MRSRQINNLKEEVVLLKDFKLVRLEIRLNNKENREFNVLVSGKDKHTSKITPNLRISLLQDDLELESYASDSGSVTFENVLPGKYRIDISCGDNLAAVSLEVNA